MAALFRPPEGFLSLYVGPVMHARLKPFGHRFQYNVFSTLVDLDKLPAVHKSSWLFAVNKFAPISFYEKDYGAKTPDGLRNWVDEKLSQIDINQPAARVLLLCYPRIFGYTFNPLSVYFCYDEADNLLATIYEVRNTFGGMHHYVEPVLDGQLTESGLRQQRDKKFYVSPFLGMDMSYAFRLLPPNKNVKIRILEHDSEGPILSATFNGSFRNGDSKELLKALIKFPFLTIKIIISIHWEALKLWVKGAKFHRNPAKLAKAKEKTI